MNLVPLRRTLRNASPSQVKNVQSCERKWWLEVVEGRRPLTTASQALGTEVHKHLELWVGTRAPRILASVATFIASGAPISASPVSEELLGLIRAGKRYEIPDTHAGRIARAAIPHLEPVLRRVHAVERRATFQVGGLLWIQVVDLTLADPWEIWDYKTAASKRYFKTAEELRSDVQMISYGRNLALELGLTHAVPVRHLYLTTRTATPSATPVDTAIAPEVVSDLWPSVEGTVRRMVDLAATGERKDALQNPKACHAYGGCPHRSICWAGGGQLQTAKGPVTMNAIQAAIAKAKAEAEAKAKGEPSPGAPPAKASEVPAQERVGTAPAGGSSPVKEEPAPATSPSALATGVVPPDAAPDSKEPPPAAEKAKRTRGKKDAAPPEAPPMALADTSAPPAGAPTTTTAIPGFVLCVGAIPIKGMGPAVDLTDYLRAREREVEIGAEVEDYGLIDFGKGAAALRSVIRTTPPAPGVYFLDAFGPTTRVALEALKPMAEVLILGR